MSINVYAKASLFIISMCGTHVLFSQDYTGLFFADSRLASITVGASPEMNMSGTYHSSYQAQDKGNTFAAIAQINLPLFTQKKGLDFDLRLGAGYLFNYSENWKVISGLSWQLLHSEDGNGKYWTTGFKLDLIPGYKTSNWLIGPHLALDYRPWIHVNPSEYVRNAFKDLYQSSTGKYSSPKEGWFYQKFVQVQTGLQITYLKSSAYVSLQAGITHDFDKLGIFSLPDIGILPFYTNLNVGVKIK